MQDEVAREGGGWITCYTLLADILTTQAFATIGDLTGLPPTNIPIGCGACLDPGLC